MPPELEDLTRRLIAFRDERDWAQFHSLKNLFISASLESNELLELAQWMTDGDLEDRARDPDFRRRVTDEVADVFIYLLLICEKLDVDLVAAAEEKIATNARKYPIERARGNARKYTEL